MKSIQKYISIIFCSVMLIWIAAVASEKEVPPRLCFAVNSQDQSHTNEISIFDAQDGNYYVFLPAYADMEQVFVVLTGNRTFSLGGINLSNGMNCSEFELEKPYVFSADDRNVATLRFFRSSNLASIHIDTVTGSMDSIHADKDYEEHASMVLYTVDGNVDYYDPFITVEGRGNTSWSRAKKPYTITLRQSSPLLNMGSSKKWVLNSNVFDATNLRNKIVYEFADSVAPNPAWAPDCTYVELYLNGQYTGLYLLCQKIDAGKDHLDLEQEDYYFELTMSDRTWDSPSAFYVSRRRSVDIVAPSNCSKDRRNLLRSSIADFQTALYSDTGINPDSGLTWSDYIDMDSWARKYLIEEVFSNFDGGQASQYFWLDASEHKIYAGPCWDYDITFGQLWGTTWSTPNCLLAQRNWLEDLSWYYVLCQKDAFVELTAEIYASDFRPLLQALIDEGIRNTASQIEPAVLCDQLRWPSLYSGTDWDASVEEMENYLAARVEFLDSLWIDGVDYCTVTLQTEETYNICVPSGSVGAMIPETDVFGASGPWYILGTGEPFDMTQPITADVTLTTQVPE